MKIYTKTGDNGTTGLFAGPRVSKNHLRIAAYGTVDELSAVLGVVSAEIHAGDDREGVAASDWIKIQELIPQVQADLFSIGAELATPEPAKHDMLLLTDARAAELESQIDQFEQRLPSLTSFYLARRGASGGASAFGKGPFAAAQNVMLLGSAKPTKHSILNEL